VDIARVYLQVSGHGMAEFCVSKAQGSYILAAPV